MLYKYKEYLKRIDYNTSDELIPITYNLKIAKYNICVHPLTAFHSAFFMYPATIN